MQQPLTLLRKYRLIICCILTYMTQTSTWLLIACSGEGCPFRPTHLNRYHRSHPPTQVFTFVSSPFLNLKSHHLFSEFCYVFFYKGANGVKSRRHNGLRTGGPVCPCCRNILNIREAFSILHSIQMLNLNFPLIVWWDRKKARIKALNFAQL